MALTNFRCFQACTSRIQACRQLLTGSRGSIHFIQPISSPRFCFCSSSELQTVCSETGFLLPGYRNYHMELGNHLSSVIIRTVQLHEEAGNHLQYNNKWADEQIFLKQLNQLSSYKDISKLLSSLESLSDTMVAATLQRLCDVQLEDNVLKNPEEVMEDEVFRSLCFQLQQQSQNLSDSGLVNALNALIKLRVDPWSTLMVRLVSESQERLDKNQMSIENLCVLAESVFSLEGSGCAMFEEIMDQIQSAIREDWKVNEIAMVYRVLQLGIGERGKYQDLLNKMNNITVTQVSQFNPRQTCTVLNALVVLDQTQALPLVIKLCKHSIRHIPHFTDDELVNVLEAFIHFGHNDQFFTEALERHVTKCAFTMHPSTHTKVMQYCSKKHILSKAIFNVVAESFVYNTDNFTTTQIAELVVPFGKLNYLPPSAPSFFRKLEIILSTRFVQFQPHVLLNLLHSCTLLERYPLNFLAKVFNPYFLQQLQTKEPHMKKLVLSQLTQMFLTVILECPSYDGPKLLPKYRVKSFLTPGHSLESLPDVHFFSRVKTGLVDLLGARTYFASHVLTPYCYTLDIEIKLDAEGFVLPANRNEDVHQRIALCIDDQKRFCTNSHNLLGREAIKQRHLQLLGYNVVQIPFFEFQQLQNRGDILEYLHRKVFPSSYRLSW
ncbi:FAST kinase domain-containing protein 3, mitochondrial [Anolis carolinensis]|uniref:FAST kinase domains 3 n=1 Tax=Anolis carolinensis TaxID=28377 RepID=G1KJU2_ANOCA|nr:PREDICTED: FAST kinase domain-containing protein 3, mitochondrial [Anolis carolinensis]XP_008107312.1 PREDICTED: FAST kinase domain-containing protein 3, mitochondrial [Anolis carolinensis]|eukprot:XP_003220122.1 PREDICTED: FAST kinase domain-containing protein 3, mitochondrial [Anolis carolinensis]